MEIRRLKARMEAERLPRGADPRTHLKLGPGGLSDVEWVVQLLQLRHAHEVAALRTTGTLSALQAAVDADLVTAEDASALSASWRAATAIRHAVVIARGVPADAIPVQPADRARVAHLLGYGAAGSEQMVEDYLRKSRQARAVVDRLFYG
jgi:glutamate-ammonia-ligase adenylyltransferase